MHWISSEFAASSTLAAQRLEEGAILGWFQGRSEIGPRALGNRSILADPRDPKLKDRINRDIKHREEWRPYAPVILAGAHSTLLDLPEPHPQVSELMLLSATMYPEPIRRGVRSHRPMYPAITHRDGSTRPQIVTEKSNPRLWDLMGRFATLTSCPVLLNTSFNDNGEPIVETPEDAIKSFQSLKLDALVLGDYFIER